MAATYTPFPNEVVEKAINDFLVSKVELRGYCTLDNSLTENPGMTKVIRRYTKYGQAVEVAPGEDVEAAGGTRMAVSWDDEEYTVKAMQQEFHAYDEDTMTDPFFVDRGIEAIGEALWNNLQEEIVAEWEKCENIIYTGAEGQDPDFDNFVDAIASLNLEDADENGFVALCGPAMKGKLRKKLRNDLKYVEGYVREGYIGHVLGIPLVVSKLVADGEIIITDANAVKVFNKKGVSASQDRFNATRETVYVGNMYYIAALVDEKKCVLILEGEEPAAEEDGQ